MIGLFRARQYWFWDRKQWLKLERNGLTHSLKPTKVSGLLEVEAELVVAFQPQGQWERAREAALW